MEITHTLPILTRLTQVIDAILGAVRAHARPRFGTPWGNLQPLDPTVVTRIWNRMRRAEAAIKSLMARWHAGKLRPPKPRGPLTRPRTRTPPALPPLPNTFAWLCPMVPSEAAARGNHLRLVLAEPEMQELLAASPRARQILKPICRMLAIDPAVLTPAPKPVAPSLSLAGSAWGEPPRDPSRPGATNPRPVERPVPS